MNEGRPNFVMLAAVLATASWSASSAHASAPSSAAILFVLAFLPDIGSWPAVGLLVAFAATSTHIMLNHAHAHAVLPDPLVGRGFTLQNVVVFFGVAAMRSATGFSVGRFTEVGEAAPEIACRSVFGFLALMIVVSLALYLPVRDGETG